MQFCAKAIQNGRCKTPTKKADAAAPSFGSFFCQHLCQDFLELGQPPQQVAGPGGGGWHRSCRAPVPRERALKALTCHRSSRAKSHFSCDPPAGSPACGERGYRTGRRCKRRWGSPIFPVPCQYGPPCRRQWWKHQSPPPGSQRLTRPGTLRKVASLVES